MAGRVIVVGSVNVDLVVTGTRLPAPGETVTGGRFARFHGGKGGNQAVAAARFGADTCFVGAVGDDAFGNEARDALAAEGVRLDALATLVDAATGVALILVDATGENLISVAGGANLLLAPGHVTAALERLRPGPGDVVLVGHEIPTGTAAAALETAHAGGATTILNPAPVGELDRRTFGLADHLTPNRVELEALLVNEAQSTGSLAGREEEPLLAASRLLERTSGGDGVRVSVLVSLGAAGALLVGRDGPPLDLPALDVTPVDTVGAGDTLNGVLAAGLAGGLTLEIAAMRAVAAASLTTTRPGARAGPTSAELEAAMAGRA